MFNWPIIAVTFWFLVSVCAGVVAGRLAFIDPLRFSNAVDMLATIVSILTGVSLAVIAVLASPFSVGDNSAKDEFEAQRMTKIVQSDERILATGQVFHFIVFLFSLVLALAFTWSFDPSAKEIGAATRWLASLTACVGVFAMFWSARLPYLLASISKRRSTLGG